MPRKTLYTYYANLKPFGKMFQGGNVLPPNMDTEPSVDIRCPDTKYTKLNAALCRVLPTNQFGSDTLLFHGTCDPESKPFPNYEDHDSLRWYAFEPHMSLDFIKEEVAIRTRKGLAVGAPTLYVYRLKRPIRNLLLFADVQRWNAMGGHEHILRNNVCGVNVDPSTDEGKMLKKRAHELGCPLPEYAMAVRARLFKVIRGNRGEACNGWVRLNAAGILENQLFSKTGFELALTTDNHDDYLELQDVFTVADDPERYGSIGRDTTPMDELDWHLTNIPPTPPRPPAPRRRLSGHHPLSQPPVSPKKSRRSMG